MPRVPRPVSGCDIKSLPLRPAEAFLLSRIDATVSEHDLSLLTGLPAHEVAAALDRLAQMGAIHFGGADQPKAPPPPERPPPQSERSLRMLAAQAGRPALDAGSPSPPLYDPAELDEDVEIDPVRKRRVLDLFYRLDDLTHYELLGVPGEVEKKQIKSAYYQLAPEFHPDTYFRKKLGSYKAKIEAVFTRITLAHDVLTSKQRRAEYDAYLEQTHRNRVMEALLDRTPRDLEAVAAAVDESAAATARIEPQRAGAKPPVADVVAASLGRYTSETRSPEEIARERREMLARKLRGGASTRPPPASMPPPASDPHAEEVASQRRAAGALKARYEAAVAEGKRQQLARYLELGRVALDRKDYAAAANAYRIASSLAPDDAQVQATCDEATRLAAAALAEGYWKQAQYEAGQER